MTHLVGYIAGSVNAFGEYSFEPTQSPPSANLIPGYTYNTGATGPQTIVHENGLLLCGGSDSTSTTIK